MKLMTLLVLLASLLSSVSADDKLADIIAAPPRGEAADRDQYRHPFETLTFFGIEPTMDVLEIWPGGSGWYTQILAPYLKNQGSLSVAVFGEGTEHQFSGFFERADKQFAETFANAEMYGTVKQTPFFAPKHNDLGEADQYDMIVTFRNLHNWLMWDQSEQHLAELFRVLKPGGILGVTDHRADPTRPIDTTASSGYVDEAYAIEVIQQAGFRLAAVSDINDNPLDEKDYANGVWTLPPTYRLGETDREKYQAIGESDRFTLKFVKPE
ncbi:MAG: methyltransferase [Lysobacteraceae bacterium]|nr:MAG: methyltransferase [Xanthomonadaceae bacterium]